MTNTTQNPCDDTSNTSNNNNNSTTTTPMEIDGEKTTPAFSEGQQLFPHPLNNQNENISSTQMTQNSINDPSTYSSNQQLLMTSKEVDHVENNIELQEVFKRNEFLEEHNKNLQTELKSSEESINEIENEIKSLKSKNETLSETLNEKDVRIQELLRLIQELIDDKNSFEQVFDDQDATLQELKHKNEHLESRCNELEQQLKDEKSRYNDLEQRLKEASSYQSALGVATTFNLSDNDQNHKVQLNEDILALHDTLENYVTNLKPNIDVDIKEAKQLLSKYKCRIVISDKDPNKPVIKAVLQRYVLEYIIEQARHYFTCSNLSNKEHRLESEIDMKTMELTNLMDKLYKNRLGDDEVTRHTSTKLRQQVYSALGIRGFNNIKTSDCKNNVHDFIYSISKNVNEMMNKYRLIKDIEKRKYVKRLAEDLVRDVVRIFYFRLKIQEPTSQYYWCKSDEKIDKSYMKGCWDEDDVDDLVVEVCSFPLIYEPLHANNFKVYTPAKVYPRQVVKQSLFQKMKSICPGTKSSDNNLDLPNNSVEQNTSDSDRTDYSPTETTNDKNNPEMMESHTEDYANHRPDSIQDNEYQTSNAQENIEPTDTYESA